MKNFFIIVNYNDFSSTKQLLENIKDYSVLDKILVIDNCSTNESFKVLKKLESSRIEVIKTEENKGYGAGINFGVKYLLKKEKEFRIIISNADIIIKKEEDLKVLIKLLNKKNVAIVAPTIIEKNKLNRGWKLTTAIRELGLSIPYIYKYMEKKYLFYDEKHYHSKISEVDVVSGCFFLIDSKTLEQVNFFDENIFLYYEENVLASKIKKLNKKTIVANKIKIIHNHSVTIDKSLKKYQKYKQLKISQEYYVKNYVKTNNLIWYSLCLVNKINLLIRNLIYRI